jgi:hypothetical protein
MMGMVTPFLYSWAFLNLPHKPRYQRLIGNTLMIGFCTYAIGTACLGPQPIQRMEHR